MKFLLKKEIKENYDSCMLDWLSIASGGSYIVYK